VTANGVLSLMIGLALVGLAGITVGVFALRSIARVSSDDASGWRVARVVMVILGVILGVASWPLTYWMGYSIPTPDGPVRLVGLPFFVASFDSQGRDYVSELTLWGCIGNVLFWFMVPQIALASSGRRWRRLPQRPAA
jgi:hypothetical protein